MGYKLMQKYWKFIRHYGIEKKKKKQKFQKTPFHSSLLTWESSKKKFNFGTVQKMTYET
jgi:hypothetical protein